MTKEYRVEIRIRNALLYNRMRAAGHSASSLCKIIGANQGTFGKLLNLKYAATDKDGALRPIILRIAEALHCKVEDIVPLNQFYKALKTNKSSFDASKDDIASIISTRRLTATPLDAMEFQEAIEAASAALSSPRISEKERTILRARFDLENGEGRTYKQLGDEMSLSVTRIREIEGRALRKLREECGLKDHFKTIIELLD